jgi:hypothetical protein
MSKKKKSNICNIIPPLRLKSPASTVWAVGFAMVRSMHEAVVTNVLGAVEIIVASVSTILTME